MRPDRAPHVVGLTEPILGYGVWGEGASSCVRSIQAWVDGGGSCRWLACLNPHSYTVALDRPEFREALASADWLVPDGSGIVLASRMLGGRIRHRVTGCDVFRGIHDALDRRGAASVFFLGSTDETLSLVRERMRRDFPNVRVAGTHAPPFKTSFSADEIDGMVRVVNKARPDVLWVGMTAPKQELWLHRNRQRLDIPFAAAVGAVFDFYAGNVKRSHPVFQRVGLEWLPRLAREPRRLWRRTFVSAPRFLLDVIRQGNERRRAER